jgi:hypothetical protein
MKNSLSGKTNYKIKKKQEYFTDNKDQKTININILLNRVRQENKNNSKKKKLLLIFTISILSLISIFVFGN